MHKPNAELFVRKNKTGKTKRRIITKYFIISLNETWEVHKDFESFTLANLPRLAIL